MNINLDGFVTIKEVDTESGFFSTFDITSVEEVDVDFPEITFGVIKKEFELTKSIEENDLNSELIENIIKLSEQSLNSQLFLKEDDSLKVMYKIQMASNMIAAGDRIGPSNSILISKENYLKYDIQKYLKVNVLFTDIKDIIVYRKNPIESPGLVLIHNNEKYSFETIGNYPENQFMKVTLDF